MKGKRNGKNSLAFGIFVLSADFSVSPLLCRVSFYLLNLTVSFVREYQQQRALHFALSLSKKRSLITVSHSFFSRGLQDSVITLGSCAALLLSLSLHRSLWPVRAFLSAFAFFAFSPSCGDELLLLLSHYLGGSLSELRRLRFVVFFHNRFICRIAVILLFRFLFGLCFCCCVGLAMLLLLLRCAAAAAAGACSTLPFAEEFHCNGPTTCAACSIMKKSLSAQTWQWQRRRRRHRRRRHINRTHNPIFYLTICCLSHFLFGFSACCAFAF